ncbi:Uncharacterised protein [Mycobacteroides abscessus subsp. massiliense]|nr:Uncharacterised protein [Mycobacteroides abscessus subsp. massiliense]
MFHSFQTIGLQCIAAGNQIDNRVAQTDQRRKLHRTVQFDDVHMHTLVGKVFGGDVGIFGGNPQAAAGFGSGGVIKTFFNCNHHAA